MERDEILEADEKALEFLYGRIIKRTHARDNRRYVLAHPNVPTLGAAEFLAALQTL